MDVLAHVAYGATLCSRKGLAGGRAGSPAARWFRDGTLWWAIFFSLLPDMLSMWMPFIMQRASGTPGNFFATFGGGWLEVYRLVHSLVVALSVSALICILRRRLFVPSLAWAVHIVCDALSHGEGKFQTLLFYPFSDWGIRGIPFWRHPEFVAAYWTLLVVLWCSMGWWRRRARNVRP